MDIFSNLTNLLGSVGGQQSQGGMGAGGGLGGLGALAGMLGGMGGSGAGNSGASFGGSGGGDALGGLGSLVGALLGGRGGNSGGSGLGALSGLAGMISGGGSGGAGAGGLGGLGSLVASLMGGQGGNMLGQLLGGEQAPPAPQANIGDAGQARAMNTLRALVYAARADGRLDDQERQSITREVQKAGLSQEGQQFVSQFLSEEVDVGKIARNITSPEEALQLYALSCAITRIDSPLERDYVDALARALRIPDATKTAIERRIAG